MIYCVGLTAVQNFPGNLIVKQHQLRYREVIVKEGWGDIYVIGDMEFDKYDDLSTEYLIAVGADGDAVGVVRSRPTTIHYMLSDNFNYLATDHLPADPEIHEASRLVLDRTILKTKTDRESVVNELVLGLMERGLQCGLKAFNGFMLPKIWASTFVRAGWDVEWLGPETPLLKGGVIARGGVLPVNEAMRDKIRKTIGITGPVLDFGKGDGKPLPPALCSRAGGIGV